jgi:hypothetical protein
MLIVLVCAIIALFLWFDQSRTFFKAANGAYITMWKRYGGTCYLIPGKYFGVTKPSDGYIETDNLNDLTIYYSNKLPNLILLRKESHNNYYIINPKDHKFLFEDYTSNIEKYKPIIYKKNSKQFSDVNEDAFFLTINIREGYASDETGKTQR